MLQDRQLDLLPPSDLGLEMLEGREVGTFSTWPLCMIDVSRMFEVVIMSL